MRLDYVEILGVREFQDHKVLQVKEDLMDNLEPLVQQDNLDHEAVMEFLVPQVKWGQLVLFASFKEIPYQVEVDTS